MNLENVDKPYFHIVDNTLWNRVYSVWKSSLTVSSHNFARNSVDISMRSVQLSLHEGVLRPIREERKQG
jgi:hypothetical protein